ncbi:hypothetical protein KXV85_002184, partial [Aspergillus fumigatus]
PLMPALIAAQWFSPSDVVYLGAANLAGYLGGALAARTVAGRIGAVPALRAMMLFRTVASGIPHHAVVDPAVSQRDDVERVILVQAPGPLRALLREPVDRAPDVSRGECEGRLEPHPGIVIMGHGLPVMMPVHVIEKPTDIFASEIAFQRPGCIGVAERRGHVRHVGIHHALVGQRAREIDGAAVDAHVEPADNLQFQPGRRHDDVGGKLPPVLQPDAGR